MAILASVDERFPTKLFPCITNTCFSLCLCFPPALGGSGGCGWTLGRVLPGQDANSICHSCTQRGAVAGMTRCISSQEQQPLHSSTWRSLLLSGTSVLIYRHSALMGVQEFVSLPVRPRVSVNLQTLIQNTLTKGTAERQNTNSSYIPS